MSVQELEEQLDTGSVIEDETIETGDDDSSDDSQDTQEEKARKNKSNWKKVSEKAKLADKLQAELEEARAELAQWEELNPEITQTKAEAKRLDAMEQRLFFAENPEAKEHKERLDAIIAKSKGALTRDEAWELIKPNLPKESESKSNFSTKSPAVNNKKDITKLSFEEASQLKGADYRKWAEANGMM